MTIAYLDHTLVDLLSKSFPHIHQSESASLIAIISSTESVIVLLEKTLSNEDPEQ